MTQQKSFEIVVRTLARLLYSFLNVMFLQVVILEKEYRNLRFQNNKSHGSNW